MIRSERRYQVSLFAVVTLLFAMFRCEATVCAAAPAVVQDITLTCINYQNEDAEPDILPGLVPGRNTPAPVEVNGNPRGGFKAPTPESSVEGLHSRAPPSRCSA